LDCYNDERFWFNAEKADYMKLEDIVEDPKDIMDVLIRLIDPRNKILRLTDGSHNKTVCICKISIV
jgi:hypothetical protein